MSYSHASRLALLVFAAGAWLILFSPTRALAATCDDEYVVRPGDSLSLIAKRSYGDMQKWSPIYNVNLRVIGHNPNRIEVGQYLRLPCLDPSPAAALPALSGSENDIAGKQSQRPELVRLLTGGGYPPFTDRGLPNDGLITDIVIKALSRNPQNPPLQITWVDDWSVHLEDLLLDHEFDMGFPWFKPDCDSTPDEFRCQHYVFSNPVFEMLILLFTHQDRPFIFNADEDIKGATLCRPRGYFTHDLEKDGRLWITNKTIRLKQPETIEACFDMLVDGSVDAVALNEFTGRTAISSMGLTGQVVALENKPLSVEGLRVVIHKEHPRADELMSMFNQSMASLQLSADYSPIIDRHFRHYWMNID